ncbi:MAG TPA: ATP-binding protein [Dermatophilaceae bacterium]|nr:ATP-binding protein [Dermatophilaceae bacterium]
MFERYRARAAQGWPIAVLLRVLVVLCWVMLLTVSCLAAGSLYLQSENFHQLTQVDDPAVDANNEVRQAMADAETGLTGYRISGDRTLLQPYFGSHERTLTALATLQGKFALGARTETDIARYNALGVRQRLAVEQWWAYALRTEQILSSGGRADVFQGRALWARFSSENATLGVHLLTARSQTQIEAQTISKVVYVSIAAAVASLLAMLLLGGWAARGISRPLTELRDTMIRQREGEPDARAREDQGSEELRFVARDFNELTKQNLALRDTQMRALATHQVTFEIARAISKASDTREALDIACAALGEGLGVDRVVADTLDPSHEVLLGSQWHRSDLPPPRDLMLPPELGSFAEELWQSTGFWAQDDLLDAHVASQQMSRIFHRETGARAVVMVPIGLYNRVIGTIYVFGVSEPRIWTTAEINLIQAVAGFVARAIVEAEHQEHQREYVKRIEQLASQKSDFLATMSHELRSPLASIGGYLELLQEEDAGELTELQHGMLKVIERSATRLRHMIENVLVLSRIEGPVDKTGYVRVSICALVAGAVEELSVVAAANSVELEVDAGPETAIVLGDVASLDRAVVNILANAIKFSHPGGVVTIVGALDEGARRVLITCQDRGVGIPAADQANLFTRFFRASNATSQAIPGSGLGLSIAKQIIEDQHGGELRLVSIEDEGTTVVIDLPLYEPAQTQGTARSESDSDQGNDSDSDHVFDLRA